MSKVIIYLIIPAINLIILFFSIQIPFFGDDFAWLVQANEQASLCIAKFLMLPAPFDYFRPLPKLFFFLMTSMADSAVPYRILISILNTLCSFLIYKLCLALKYSERVSVIAALTFSLLACHAEGLFFINCINEIFSAIFIMSGLYFLAQRRSTMKIIVVILFFLAAMLSRESAVVYVLLVLLVNYRCKNMNIKKMLLIIVIPVLVYGILRFYSENYLQGSNLISIASRIDLNPVRIVYKFVQYFFSMILPVKLLFDAAGFEKLNLLISIIKDPGSNLIAFSIIFVIGFSVFAGIAYYLIKTLKKDVIFPLLFILFSLSIYLLSFDTAERFLFLPSAGMCLLIGIFLSGLKSVKLSMVVLLFFLSFHFASLLQRSQRYFEAAEYSRSAMNDLFLKTSDMSNGSNVLLESIPPKKFGVFFLSIPNLNYNWKYNFPERKINYVFPGEENGDAVAVLRFDENEWKFVRVK